MHSLNLSHRVRSGHAYDVNDKEELKNIAETDSSNMMKFMKLLQNHISSLPDDTYSKSKMDLSSLDISVGSTPSLFSHRNDMKLPNLEMHPGNYTLYDRQQLWSGACTSEPDIAVRIMSRVIGHYKDRNTIMLDAGATALTKETTPQGGVCAIAGRLSDLECYKMSQEMILVRPTDYANVIFPYEDFALGKEVFLIPNHSCLAVACFDEYHIIDDVTCGFSSEDEIIDRWIPAKGW
mmetsp:Transcript_10275/g.15135  ORF Transcript_10275/g.15135 Transcript_10275/m.15135 type:complete len:236 (+) Transcript_10275:556-1263(+)